jgi:DUF2997 family protein
MATTITIEFSPRGEAKVSVSGVKGSACKDLTRRFEQALGQTTADTETGEYFEKPNIQTLDQY